MNIGDQIRYFTDPDPDTATFRPVAQHVNSNQKYTGMGFLPCNGHLPCQVPDIRYLLYQGKAMVRLERVKA